VTYDKGRPQNDLIRATNRAARKNNDGSKYLLGKIPMLRSA
jgi:hypothetical protein